jgi:hypothetical protein
MHPTHGGRVVLDRRDVSAEAVTYDVVLYTPDERFASVVTVRLLDGDVVFGDFSPVGPPAYLVTFARAFLRSEWRERKDDPAGDPWPERLMRWRDER